MKKKFISILLMLVLTFVSTGIPAVYAEEAEYYLSQRYVRFIGRNDVNELYGRGINWPGAGFEFKFTGTSADVYVNHLTASSYFNVIIDGGEPTRILLTTGWNSLATDLEDTEHTIEFIRSSEGNNGCSFFGKIRVNGTTPVPTVGSRRKIEFYGDSFTVGYGNTETDPEGTKNAENTDNYYAYSSVTARALNAEPSIIAHSGRGVAINNSGGTTGTVPEIAKYAQHPSGKGKGELWDYSKFTPQVVVVFLGINDHFGKSKEACTVTDKNTYITDAYKELVNTIRTNYPKANVILCSRTSRSSEALIDNVFNELSPTDSRLHRFVFDPCPAQGIAGHPTVENHQVLANALVEKINSIEGVWQDAESLDAVSHKTDVVVKGKVPFEYGNKQVTLIMKKKDWDVTNFAQWNENIAYLEEQTIDDEGNYLFRFATDVDVSGYELLLNQGGKVINDTVISALAKSQLVTAELELTQEGNRVDLAAQIINKYGFDGINYNIFIASYKNDGMLAEAKMTTLKELSESVDTDNSLYLDVSSDISYVRAYLWDETMLPLSDDKYLPLSF